MLLWHGDAKVSLGWMLFAGGVVWAGYTLLYCLLNPAVLDEVVIPAQIIAGAVHYPEGHPHNIYYQEAFSLTNYLAAAGLRLGLDALALSRIRNAWFLFSSVYTSFALALLLIRQPRWAHVSGVLTACNLIVPFGGAYPIFVPPAFWSHGHIGLQTALLSAALLLAGYARTGGFLLGLLPSVHAAMALVLWPWGLAYLFARKLRQAVIPLVCGVIACAILAAIIWLQAPSSRVLPPYDPQLDGRAVLEAFTTYTDVHRQLPSLFSLAYLANSLAFFVLGALFLWSPGKPDAAAPSPSARSTGAWLLLLAAISWAIVYAAWIVHRWHGILPTWVSVVMPYRFSNVSATLILPLSVALLARLDERVGTGGRRVLMLLTIALLVAAGHQTLMTGGWSSAMQPRDLLIVVLWGFVLGGYLCTPGSGWDTRLLGFRLAIAGSSAILGFGIYAAVGRRPTIEFGLAMACAGSALAIVQTVSRGWRTEDRGRRWSFIDVAFAVVCIAAGLATLHNRYPDRAVGTAGMTISAFDRELSEWLSQHAGSQELIAVPVDPVLELQAKTAHPVLAEAETLWLMSYSPKLAGVVGAIARDIYGVDYTDTSQIERLKRTGTPTDPVWLDAWRTRSPAAWASLRRKYGVRLVLSSTPLQLPVAMAGTEWSVYEIPAEVPTNENDSPR